MKPTGNPHAMPLPSNSPWKSESMPWSMTPAMQQNSVMQFCAPNLGQKQFTIDQNHHKKRKAAFNREVPDKIFISEEKVIARFNGMHLSSNFTEHNACSSSSSVDNDDNSMKMEYFDFTSLIPQKELEEKLKNANRITVCDQVKKLQSAHNSFIPNALINRIERPCTALVLWTPPAKLEDLLPGSSNNIRLNNNSIDFDTIEEEEDNNNSTNYNMNRTDPSAADGMDTDL